MSKYSTPHAVNASASDARLVEDCLNGNEDAWLALIDRYKSLIYSIPLKYGLSADDAAEIFQSVCLSLLAELPKIRDPCGMRIIERAYCGKQRRVFRAVIARTR